MRNLSNEVKVGIIAILTIIVFIWLYNFLKGKNLLNSEARYYAVYEKVGGLGESSPVEVNGYKVGVVQSINFIDALSGRLLVEFSVDKDFKIPVNTIAEIVPVSVLGGMKVQFIYGEGPDAYNNLDTMPGRLAESMIDALETELIPLKNNISDFVTDLDSVVSSINDVMNDQFKKDLGGTLSNLNNTTQSLEEILGSKEKELKATLDNLNRFTGMLSENSGKLNETFSNLKSITDTLAAADIYTTVSNLKASLEQTALLVDNINKGKGSVGKLMTNDSLYTNLNNSLESLNKLLLDMKANPKRYVHFSVFGKKNSPPEE